MWLTRIPRWLLRPQCELAGIVCAKVHLADHCPGTCSHLDVQVLGGIIAQRTLGHALDILEVLIVHATTG